MTGAAVSDTFSGLLRRLRGTRRAPEAPRGLRLYAVGDIHGCLPQLEELLQLILRDSHDAKGRKHVVFVGDYIDRGPDSKGVVERLLAPMPGFTATFLLGNHEQTLLDFLENPSVYREWKYYGGVETLVSYGVSPPRFDDDAAHAAVRDQLRQNMPDEHIAFLRRLEEWAVHGDYFFVHAGIRPGIPLGEQDKRDLIWIRDEFLQSQADFGKVIVHGHTPMDHPENKPNRIGIDTGAYATGRLTAVVLEGTGRRFLQP